MALSQKSIPMCVRVSSEGKGWGWVLGVGGVPQGVGCWCWALVVVFGMGAGWAPVPSCPKGLWLGCLFGCVDEGAGVGVGVGGWVAVAGLVIL